jgi:hypothetical protein|tara:strand:- start:5333 stop:5560 length:228 start_codon:yes stop_codon:yes gene_type:complete
MKNFIDKSLRFHHRDIHEELNAMKVRAQVKSRWYYIFWGVATVSVVAGQIYVGSGYRQMSKQLMEMTDAYLSRNK